MKKLLSVILIFAMLVTLTACGDNDSGSRKKAKNYTSYENLIDDAMNAIKSEDEDDLSILYSDLFTDKYKEHCAMRTIKRFVSSYGPVPVGEVILEKRLVDWEITDTEKSRYLEIVDFIEGYEDALEQYGKDYFTKSGINPNFDLSRITDYLLVELDVEQIDENGDTVDRTVGVELVKIGSSWKIFDFISFR